MGVIVTHNQPCLNKACSSSDARQIYEDGSSFCFSCGEAFSAKQEEDGDYEAPPTEKKAHSGMSTHTIKEIKSYAIRGFKERKIPKDICEFFDVRVSYDSNGDIDEHFYPYDNNTYNVRKVPKDFYRMGKFKKPFGMDKFNAGGKRLIICEGEIDAMSVAQASMVKYKKIYPVICIPGVTHTKLLLENRKWIRSFQEVVLMFDEDEAGDRARAEAIRVIGYDKVKVAKLSEKDANEVLIKHGSQMLNTAVWDAAGFTPAGICEKEELWKSLTDYNKVQSIPYPPCLAGLNDKLKGRRYGEIALFISGSGCGKSSMMREIMVDAIEHTEEKIGIISLEESPAETARKLSGMMLNLNPADAEIPEEDLRVGFDKMFVDDRVILLDHQGAVRDQKITDYLEYMCLMGATSIFIDHITILVSEGVDDLRGCEAQDKIMNELLRIVKTYPVWIGLVSHLRKSPGGGKGKSFEEGGIPTLDDIRGCLAYDTGVLRADGTAVAVQDVRIGDTLMGSEGFPRKVLKLCRGSQRMYKVTTKTSKDSFICNEDHMLTMSHNGRMFDLSVGDFLQQSKSFQSRCKQHYTEGYELPGVPVEIPPYSLGAWLGDGSKAAFRVMDASTLGIADRIAVEIGATLGVPRNINKEYFNFNTGKKGEMLEKLRRLNVLNNKHIPVKYMLNSKAMRYQLLAGLLDTGGSYSQRDQAYYFYQKDEVMAKQVRDIARSLGFYSTANSRIISCDYSSDGSIIWEVAITGNITKIPAQKRVRIAFIPRRTDPLKRGIIIEALEEASYYGFLLDGDGRYVLENHVITHNSGSIKQISFDVIAFGRNTVAETTAERNRIKIVVLKSRFAGLTGPVDGTTYDVVTGRLTKADRINDEDFTEEF